jgi:hypothetical protein
MTAKLFQAIPRGNGFFLNRMKLRRRRFKILYQANGCLPQHQNLIAPCSELLCLKSERNLTPPVDPMPMSARINLQERQMSKKEDGRIVETAMEARGAERGPTVRNVLVWSTGLVVVGFATVYLIYF